MRQAYTAEEPGRFELRDVDKTPPGPGEVQFRIRNCGICGSDLHPLRHPERWRAGRCLGHEVSGEVAVAGEGVERVAPGDRVALMPIDSCGRCDNCRSGSIELCSGTFSVFGLTRPGGFGEYLTVPEQNLFRLPPGVDFALGALTEPLAVVVHGHRLAAQLDGARPTAGERMVVLGAGIIGLLAAFYARQAGAGEIAITARHEHQANAARQLGATHVLRADDEGAEELRSWAAANPVDLVMETVGGDGETLPQAVSAVRRGGRICVLGAFGQEAAIPAQGLIGNEPRIVGAWGYGYIGGHADYDVALELLRRFGDVLGNLITHRVPLAEVERGFQLAVDKSSGSIKVTVEP